MRGFRILTAKMNDVLGLFEEPFENWPTFATPNNVRHVHEEESLDCKTEPPSLPEDIETVIWHSRTYAWEQEWELLGRLRNGLFFFYQARCLRVKASEEEDVLRGDMTMTLGDTLADIVKLGMPEHSRLSYQVETTHSFV